jgi:hypothetical protein
VYENAFLVSRDTLSEDGYDQIKGQRLIGLFKDNELYNVDIIKNAETIRYLRNDETELIGIQKSKSGKINIRIVDKVVEEVRFINQIDGNIFPEPDFPKSARRLRGFDWRGEERPLSVEDLFTDDPPLDLPVIKGLDPYVPPEEFIDDSVNERIEEAGKATPNKPNKAARNIPEDTKIKPLPLEEKATDSTQVLPKVKLKKTGQ